MTTVSTRDTVMVAWSLCMEWHCVPEDMTEAEEWVFLDARQEKLKACDVEISRVLIRDRLYGGFACDEPGRIHVAFNTGQYTYCNPELNKPVSPEWRAEAWAELIAENAKNPANASWRGKVGPFTEDAPT